ncbi:glycosyltransferase family 4 protein [Candidatus Woesearchaeota archaeon]|nr:glycosyltransferase family 4 protein [Candidatus Woesearchaeota archaeon]
MKTVALVGLTPPIPGGSMWHILEVARNLKKVRPIVITQKGTTAGQEKIESKTSVYWKSNNTYLRNISFFITSIPNILKAIKTVDVFHVHESFLFPWIPYLKRRNKKVVVTVHGCRGFAFFDNKFLWGFFKKWLSKADKIIAVGTEDKKLLEKEFPEKVVYIPNGVNLHEFPQARTQGENIVFIGRIHSQKGVHILLEAFQRIKQTFPKETLILAGPAEGGYADKLKKRYNDPRIRFIGEYKKEDLQKICREAKCVVLPSLWEGLPLTLIEALASGKPVIATNLPSIASIVKNKKNGLLVPPNDISALVTALQLLLKNKAAAQKLGKEARKTAEHYDWRAIALKTEHIYLGQ